MAKRKRRLVFPAPAVFELERSWTVKCTVAAPDPTGYRAVILDENNVVVATSIPERAPIDFENHTFAFTFVPPVTLNYKRHTYRIGVQGPSGIYLPFTGFAPPQGDPTDRIKVTTDDDIPF